MNFMLTRCSFVSASTALIAALVISNAAFAQRDPFTAVVGTVESISGNLIHVRSGAQLLTLRVDDHTEVWKGKIFHDLSTVEIGDDLSARCHENASLQVVAEGFWINIVNFFGVITDVKGGTFEVFTRPDAESH